MKKCLPPASSTLAKTRDGGVAQPPREQTFWSFVLAHGEGVENRRCEGTDVSAVHMVEIAGRKHFKIRCRSRAWDKSAQRFMTDDLYDTDIPWHLPPMPRIVPQPDEPSTPDDLGWLYADMMATEAHLTSVQADLASYRELVQRALECMADLTATLRKRDATIADQAQQIRALMDCDPGQRTVAMHGSRASRRP